MHEFSDMAEVESTLERLASREDGPYVVRLAREPGKRESRYMHLFAAMSMNCLSRRLRRKVRRAIFSRASKRWKAKWRS